MFNLRMILAALLMLALPGCFLIPGDNVKFLDNAYVARYLDATSLSLAGNRSCALRNGDELWCWGENFKSTIDASGATQIPTPTRIRRNFEGVSANLFTQVAQDSNNICGIIKKTGDQVACWGSWGESLLYSDFATQKKSRLSKIAIGQNFGCGVDVSGKHVECFGEDQHGRGLGEEPEDGLHTNKVQLAAGFNGAVRAIAKLNDDSYLVGGDFSEYSGFETGPLARVYSDGTLDLSFRSYDFISKAGSPEVRAILVQLNGNVLVGGLFYRVGTSGQRANLLRLKSTMTLDDEFSADVFNSGKINALALLGDERIVVGGAFNEKLKVLDSIGFASSGYDVGTGFNGEVNALAIGPGGDTIYVAGDFTSYNSNGDFKHLAKLDSSGSADVIFSANLPNELYGSAKIYALAIQSNALMVGGKFSANSNQNFNLLRLDLNGNLDEDFKIKIGNSSTSNYVNKIRVTDDGDMYFGGWFDQLSVPGQTLNTKNLAKLSQNRTTVEGFLLGLSNQDFVDQVHEILPLSTEEILVGFESFTNSSSLRHPGSFFKLKASGHLDSGFGYNHRVVDLQASGYSTCARIEAKKSGRDTIRNLQCWGLNSYQNLLGSFDNIDYLNPELVARDIYDFRLSPARLCYTIVSGRDDWTCRGAYYSKALGGFHQFDPFFEDISSEEISFDPELYASDFLQGGLKTWAYLTKDFVELGGISSFANEYFSGYPYSCRLDSGQVKCTGEIAADINDLESPTSRGRTGAEVNNGWSTLSKANMKGSNKVIGFDIGENHGCLLGGDGLVHCWGDNRYGQLGLGNAQELPVYKPTPIRLQ
jgi:hypothetical protein